MGSTWAIVVAGGSGSRYGGLKQFEPLAGRRVVDWSLAAARESCDGVVLVVPAGVEEAGAVAGGVTRSDSVRAGLAAVPDDAEVVLVHDAARPLAGPTCSPGPSPRCGPAPTAWCPSSRSPTP